MNLALSYHSATNYASKTDSSIGANGIEKSDPTTGVAALDEAVNESDDRSFKPVSTKRAPKKQASQGQKTGTQSNPQLTNAAAAASAAGRGADVPSRLKPVVVDAAGGTEFRNRSHGSHSAMHSTVHASAPSPAAAAVAAAADAETAYSGMRGGDDSFINTGGATGFEIQQNRQVRLFACDS